jgi:hypothetical protein
MGTGKQHNGMSCIAMFSLTFQVLLRWICTNELHSSGLNRIKVKLCPLLTYWALCHGDIWGSGCVDPHILDLGTSGRWEISFTPRLLYSWGRSPRYPLDRRLRGPQSLSGRREEENSFAPTKTRTPTPRSSSPQPVRIVTTVSRLP